MELVVSETDYCKINVKYTADLEEVKTKRHEVLVRFKGAPVPGFREKKTSLEVIRMYYHKQIEEAVKRAMAEEAFHNTLFEKQIKPFGTPNFTELNLMGNKFSCEFNLQKRPDFSLGEYKGLSIPKPHVAETQEEAYEKMMQDIRVKFGHATPYEEDDFVQMEDQIIVSYDLFDQGVKVEGISTDGEMMVVGKSDLPGFDDNLLGMKVGDTREFELDVPKNALPSIAGKNIKFSTTVLAGSKMTPMALDDELAVRTGKATFDELKEFVMGAASTRIQNLEKEQVLQQVQARLIEMHDFQVPSWLTESEAKYLTANAKVDFATLSAEDQQQYLAVAEKNVKLALILDQIREVDPETQLSDQEVLDLIKKQADAANAKYEDLMAQLQATGYLTVLVARIRDEFTLDFIVKNSNIIE